MPLKSCGAVSYSPTIVTMTVSLAVCEIFSVKEWCDFFRVMVTPKWLHTVCLVYGRHRPNRCSAQAQVPSVCRRLPHLRCHVSKCISQCHRPAFALSSRRRRLDECKPTTPERQQDTSAVARLPAQHRQTHCS